MVPEKKQKTPGQEQEIKISRITRIYIYIFNSMDSYQQTLVSCCLYTTIIRPRKLYHIWSATNPPS